MIAYIELFSALLSRLTALACGSTWVTSCIARFLNIHRSGVLTALAWLVQWWHHNWHDDYTTQTIQPTAPSWRWRYNLQLQVKDDCTTYSSKLKMIVQLIALSWRRLYNLQLWVENDHKTYSSMLKMTVQLTALSWKWPYSLQLWVENDLQLWVENDHTTYSSELKMTGHHTALSWKSKQKTEEFVFKEKRDPTPLKKKKKKKKEIKQPDKKYIKKREHTGNLMLYAQSTRDEKRRQNNSRQCLQKKTY